jgi:hypothetical protein
MNAKILKQALKDAERELDAARTRTALERCREEAHARRSRNRCSGQGVPFYGKIRPS